MDLVVSERNYGAWPTSKLDDYDNKIERWLVKRAGGGERSAGMRKNQTEEGSHVRVLAPY